MLAVQRAWVVDRSEYLHVVENATVSVEHVVRATLRYGMTKV
jgi:hypothetical protein